LEIVNKFAKTTTANLLSQPNQQLFPPILLQQFLINDYESHSFPQHVSEGESCPAFFGDFANHFLECDLLQIFERLGVNSPKLCRLDFANPEGGLKVRSPDSIGGGSQDSQGLLSLALKVRRWFLSPNGRD
jgi:hypothetical protein